MNINKNNYEAFFLDYHEGNLTPQQVADLLLFVEQHPELKEEFESFENVTLDDLSDITFEDKSELKKNLTPDNREDYFIRSVEGTLTNVEQSLLNNFIKQHPAYAAELELFHKTKLTPELILFENKNDLKRFAVATDDILIASVEGILTKSETVLLQQQLAGDANMQHEFSLYQKTKVSADLSIVFENKDELKRKERKVIPFFYYASGIAAAILILFGLFFIFRNTNENAPKFAKNNIPAIENKASDGDQQKAVQGAQAKDVLHAIELASSGTKNPSVKNKKRSVKKELPVNSSVNKELPENPIAENKKETIPQQEVNEPTVDHQPTTVNNQALASNQKKNETAMPEELLSLRELAAEKIKEKALDENTVAMQKKSGRLKKFSGWDLAQLVTKGISKLTGRDLEVKPTYNDEGIVTAYALGNGGLQISRGK